MADPLVIFITASSPEEAESISRALVEEKLAACTNIVPGIRSIYRWEGSVCDDKEILLICKSKASCLDRLISRVKELHSYDCPEIISLPIKGGNPDYLSWLENNTI